MTVAAVVAVAAPRHEPAPDRAAARGRAVHVVAEAHPLADALSGALAAAGARVTRGAADAAGAADVVFLGAATAAPERGEEAVSAAFRALRELGRQRGAGARRRIVVVTASGGDLGLAIDPGARAVAAAVAGLAKTAAREWSEVAVAVIDIAPAADTAEAARRIADEMQRAELESEVGLRPGGERVVPQLVRATTRTAAPRVLTRGGLWVVSGGARGVTAPCLLALARRVPLTFALLGRTPIEVEEPERLRGCRTDAALKQGLLEEARRRGETIAPKQLQQRAAAIAAAREARGNCEALRAAGAQVRYLALDIADGAAVAEALAGLRAECGPVRGVVHAAGVLADKAIHEKTDEQFAAVWRTKVGGFRALLRATADDPLEVLCAFSSVAARMGNAGQADYAAANEALNKLCQAERHRRGAACGVHAINWGPWEGGMVTPGLKAHFAAMGVPLIPLATGAEVFADIVTGRLPVAVEAVVGGVLPRAAART